MWLRTIFRRRTSSPAQPAKGHPPTPLDERLLRRLERLALSASRSLAGGMSGVHPSRRRLPAPTFTDYRPYTSGDDPRYVDWNAYARLDHLQIKLGETEQDVRVYVLVDCSASMDWGEGDTNKLHSARLLAAALGYVALASGDRLEVIPFADGRRATWGPASGRQRGASLLQYLQRLEAGGASSLSSVLAQLARERRPGLLVIASDFWHTAGAGGQSAVGSRQSAVGDGGQAPDSQLQAFEAAISRFATPRWQVLVLHLLHPDEVQPNLRGEVDLVDSETGVRLGIQADRQGLEAYMDAVAEWCDGLEYICAQRQMVYARLTTDLSIERAIVPYLRARKVLR